MGKWKSEAAASARTIERMRSDSAERTADLRNMRTEFLGLQDDAQMTREQLAQRSKELRAKDEELRVKAKRMDDLDGRPRAQTDAMSSLRKKISDALVGVKAEDLTISERDGKIYVSLSEKLLFASGSAKVDPKGKEALGKLADVLRSNADINVMVEGHTDSIPVKSSKYGDKWDQHGPRGKHRPPAHDHVQRAPRQGGSCWPWPIPADRGQLQHRRPRTQSSHGGHPRSALGRALRYRWAAIKQHRTQVRGTPPTTSIEHT
jgi:outer membrane protein OmpA-like peptidoglycan-associated protein